MIISSTLFAVLLSFGYYYYRQRLRISKQLQSHLQLEKELAQAELAYQQLQELKLQREVELTQKDLTNLSLEIKHRRHSVTEFVGMLNDVVKNGDQNLKRNVVQVKRTLESELANDAAGFELKTNIDRVNTAFFDKLTDLHPKLTKRELEVCGLVRLGMANKDIASLSQVSDDAVKKVKYRVKQRLELGPSQSLSAYLSKI